jgi:hypothetical protein
VSRSNMRERSIFGRRNVNGGHFVGRQTYGSINGLWISPVLCCALHGQAPVCGERAGAARRARGGQHRPGCGQRAQAELRALRMLLRITQMESRLASRAKRRLPVLIYSAGCRGILRAA